MLRGRFFLIPTRGYAETRGASVGTDILHISPIGVWLYLGLKTLPTFREANAVFGNFFCTSVLASTCRSRWSPSPRCRTSFSCWLMIMLYVIVQQFEAFLVHGMAIETNFPVFRPNQYQLTALASITRPTLTASQMRVLVSTIAMSPTRFVRLAVRP